MQEALEEDRREACSEPTRASRERQKSQGWCQERRAKEVTLGRGVQETKNKTKGNFS